MIPLCTSVQAAQIPADPESITEMIGLMDANHDGSIGWDEFQAFMAEEFGRGKSLLSGEYVLPSGEGGEGQGEGAREVGRKGKR